MVFFYVTYMCCVVGHFQEVGYHRNPTVTSRDVKSNFLTGLRPGDADRQEHELPAGPGKGGRGGHEGVAKGMIQGQNMLGTPEEGKDRKAAGMESPRAENKTEPLEMDYGQNGKRMIQKVEVEQKNGGSGADRNRNKLDRLGDEQDEENYDNAEAQMPEVPCGRDGLDRQVDIQGSGDGEPDEKDHSGKVNAERIVGVGVMEDNDYGDGPNDRGNHGTSNEEKNKDESVTEGYDCEQQPGCELQDSDNIALMQRRKRGRSPSPRRRRRHRAEAARRAARARWTIRGTPSRAPPPERTRTSSARAFPPAPWSRRTTTEATEEEEAVCVEEPEVEAAGSARDAAGPSTGGGAAIPGLNDLDPRIRWWCDIIGLTNPMNTTDHLNVLSPDTTSTIISNLQGQGDIERARTSGVSSVSLASS